MGLRPRRSSFPERFALMMSCLHLFVAPTTLVLLHECFGKCPQQNKRNTIPSRMQDEVIETLLISNKEN